MGYRVWWSGGGYPFHLLAEAPLFKFETPDSDHKENNAYRRQDADLRQNLDEGRVFPHQAVVTLGGMGVAVSGTDVMVGGAGVAVGLAFPQPAMRIRTVITVAITL